MDESAGQEAERGTASGGIIVGPGEGRTIRGTDAITLIATAEETGGSIGVFEDISSPGDGPPRHVHYGSDELFYLLEGEFLFLLGERQKSVVAGTYVFAPGARSTPTRSSGPSEEGCFRLSSPQARSRPLRSLSSYAPREKR